MKPWARYTFNGKDWIPDKEADIITAYKEYYRKLDAFKASKQRVYDAWGNTLKKSVEELFNEELTKGIKTMETIIAPTNVISFKYSNGNDDSPLVLVTGVSKDYVEGYNLHYHQDSGLVYRKYFRKYMSEITNITNDILSPKKTLFKDLPIGQKFKERGYDSEFVKINMDRSSNMVIFKACAPFPPSLSGSVMTESMDVEVIKL